MEEAVKAIGWPHVAFVFAVIFVLLFRRQVGALLGRVTEIGKTGIKATPAPEAQRETQKTEAAQELLVAIGDSIVLRDVEGRIRGELERRGLSLEGDTVKVLIKNLGASQILVEFEQIHNFIFGSQIFLLKKLNEVAGQGKAKEFIEAHFKNVKELFPNELGSWSLDQYLRFLFGRALIVVNGETYHITNLGVEYLTWMSRNGRSENQVL